MHRELLRSRDRFQYLQSIRLPLLENDVDTTLQRAVVQHQAGHLAQAETLYRKILRKQKNDPNVLHLLAILMYQRGQFIDALSLQERSLKVRPRFPAALNSRGLTLIALNRHKEAIDSFDRALLTEPAYALAAINRGHALASFGQQAEALASYDQAITIESESVEAHYAKGILLQKIGAAAEARACYDRAIALRSDFAEAFNNRGSVNEELGRYDEALVDYERAISLRPGFAEALNNRGVALDRLGRHDDALASFKSAVAIQPNFCGALVNIAEFLYSEGHWENALAYIHRCLVVNPTDVKARLARLMYQLPIIYREEKEITECRKAYEAELLDLCSSIEADPHPGRFADAMATVQPFFLAYQGYSDFELQLTYGRLVSRIMADYARPLTIPAISKRSQRIRVGFVCGFFRQHPVWRIPTQGWITQLDRSRFEIFGYHTSGVCDTETELAAASCDRFIQGPLTPSTWREAIINDALHVLIYPEIGMDRTSAWLAAQRLAPVQCNSWGHPDTSGFSTIDYFLSSAAMEPQDAKEHYTEQLIALPNLGIYYENRLEKKVQLSHSEIGLRPSVPTFWCGQSLYKYLPQFDYLFPLIARELGDCQFVFIRHHYRSYITNIFETRMSESFHQLGMDSSQYCVMLPRLDGDRFLAAIGLCDVVLDSVGWSGCNSTLESLAHNLPIVTLAGKLMRGRHTAAMLEMMGLNETIARTLDDYVALAIRLVQDQGWRETVKYRILHNKYRVYRDKTVIKSLEQFLETCASNSIGVE